MRRTLVSYSQQAQARNGGTVFDARYFDSVSWNGEIWLGFEDGTDGPRPYRVVRADTGCTYKSIADLHNGW